MTRDVAPRRRLVVLVVGARPLVIPLGHARAHLDHAHQLALHDAADPLDLVARVPRPQLRARRAVVGEGRRADAAGRAPGGRCGQGAAAAADGGGRGVAEVVGVARRVGRVAVGFFFAVETGAAGGGAAAGDAAVAVADAGAETAEDGGVLVAPLPDAGEGWLEMEVGAGEGGGLPSVFVVVASDASPAGLAEHDAAGPAVADAEVDGFGCY